MDQIQEWYDAVREHALSVVVAGAAVAAVFGFDFNADQQDGLIQYLDEVVLAVAGGAATVNVLVARAKNAWKSDVDIDTGPSTPGPLTADDE